MSISVVCQLCAARVKAPNGATGQSLLCPICKAPVRVPGSLPQSARSLPPTTLHPPLADAAPASVPHLPVASATPPRTPRPARRRERDAEPDEAGEPRSARGGRGGSAATSLGVGSLVLGVVALPIAFIPCMGVFSLPLSGLGLALGLVGLVLALAKDGGRSVGLPVAGAGVSLLAGFLGLLWLFVLAGVAGTVDTGPAAPEPPAARPGDADAPAPAPAAPASKRSPEYQDAEAGPVIIGDTVILVENIQTGRVPLLDLGREKLSEKKHLQVRVRIYNYSTTRKLDYRTWAATPATFRATGLAALSDEYGNRYKQAHFGLGVEVVDQLHRGASIHPKDRAIELLVFEQVVDRAKELFLDLPMSALGGGPRESVRIRIPTSAMGKERIWVPDKPAAEPAAPAHAPAPAPQPTKPAEKQVTTPPPAKPAEKPPEAPVVKKAPPPELVGPVHVPNWTPPREYTPAELHRAAGPSLIRHYVRVKGEATLYQTNDGGLLVRFLADRGTTLLVRSTVAAGEMGPLLGKKIDKAQKRQVTLDGFFTGTERGVAVLSECVLLKAGEVE